LQSWDTANKTGELNDYSVCTTWGYYDVYFYLLDVFRKRLNYPDLKRAVVDQWRLDNPNRVLIEDKSSGIPLIQELRADGIFGIESYKPTPGSDKYLRRRAQSIKFESGKGFLPSEAPTSTNTSANSQAFPAASTTTRSILRLKLSNSLARRDRLLQ
jgi:predicted phage terminase large subunit-like protein